MMDALLGKRILITAAAGGVGSIAIQLCKLWGLHVTATAGRHETKVWVKQLGADNIIDHTKTFKDQIQSSEQLFDYCLNAYDDSLIGEIASVMKPRSQITVLLPMRLHEGWLEIFSKRITIHCENVSSRPKLGYEQEVQGQILDEIAELVDSGKIKSTVGREFKWEEMVEAQNYLESGKTIGKIVMQVPVL